MNKKWKKKNNKENTESVPGNLFLKLGVRKAVWVFPAVETRLMSAHRSVSS